MPEFALDFAAVVYNLFDASQRRACDPDFFLVQSLQSSDLTKERPFEPLSSNGSSEHGAFVVPELARFF